jgi:hypothetical protein
MPKFADFPVFRKEDVCIHFSKCPHIIDFSFLGADRLVIQRTLYSNNIVSLVIAEELLVPLQHWTC